MHERKRIKAALLGLGTVGGGVYKLAERQKNEMEQKAGAELEIAKILVRDKEKVREGVRTELLTDNWTEILEDPQIEIVIEVMGGIEPAKTRILEALRAGKHVVTANKDLVAEYGRELLDAAESTGADFLFEAAVAGGIPIIRPLKQCLAANEIREITGIVNGTTNYILTKCMRTGWILTRRWQKQRSWGMRKRIRRRILKDMTPEGRWLLWHLLPSGPG